MQKLPDANHQRVVRTLEIGATRSFPFRNISKYALPSTADPVLTPRHENRLHAKSKLSYFEQEDILHLVISEEDETDSLELSPNVTAELNERGELIGIEILNASTFVQETFVEGAQAKLLQLLPAGK